MISGLAGPSGDRSQSPYCSSIARPAAGQEPRQRLGVQEPQRAAADLRPLPARARIGRGERDKIPRDRQLDLMRHPHHDTSVGDLPRMLRDPLSPTPAPAGCASRTRTGHPAPAPTAPPPVPAAAARPRSAPGTHDRSSRSGRTPAATRRRTDHRAPTRCPALVLGPVRPARPRRASQPPGRARTAARRDPRPWPGAAASRCRSRHRARCPRPSPAASRSRSRRADPTGRTGHTAQPAMARRTGSRPRQNHASRAHGPRPINTKSIMPNSVP